MVFRITTVQHNAIEIILDHMLREVWITHKRPTRNMMETAYEMGQSKVVWEPTGAMN